MAVTLTMPTTPGTGRLSIGLGFPPQLAHWPQAIIPLVLTGLVMAYDAWRRSRQQKQGI